MPCMYARTHVCNYNKHATYRAEENVPQASISYFMCLRRTGITMSGELSCGRWPFEGMTSTMDVPPRCLCQYSDTTTGTARSWVLWRMWQGTVMSPRTERRSLENMVCNTLRAMSGRMLNRVRLNSWTATDSMSPPTHNGANPDAHAL